MHTRNPLSRWICSAFVATLAMLAVTPARLSADEFQKSRHMVPMRDGVRLATDVYLPGDGDGKYPTIFMRGPYGKGGGGQAEQLCRRGYALVVQDIRGRFDSEGSDAIVFHNGGWSKRRDGHDSVTWIAEQPWSNGKIGTQGGSALGITQNMLAPGAPAALKAQVVTVAFSNMYTQSAFQGGVWRKSLIETWLKGNRFDPRSLETFIAHPKYDDFWAEFNAEAQAQRVHSPAIYLGGWYDIFQQGTINSFTTVHNQGGAGARGNCRLILGPWAHGPFNELEYPPNSAMRPEAASPFRFMDHWVKGEKNGVADDRPVHYYVMGDPTAENAPGNFWREADNWPPPADRIPFYFTTGGKLSRTTPRSADAKLTYQYDPQKPVSTIGGQNLMIPKGPMDQRKVESRDDVLLFSTGTLTEPIEVTGRILAKLYVTSDCPDTDFTVKLTDVYPDGRSMLVTDGILRARYRRSFEREDFLEAGKVYELTVDLWSTSLVFNAGHQVRIAVSSSNSPRFDPNPNTGKPFRANNETRIATNSLHLSQEYPSHVILPLFRKAER